MAANEYIVGQVIQLRDVVTDPNSTPTPNTPVDDSTAAVAVWKPDGSLVNPAPTVTHGSVGSGLYTATITVDQSGWWTYRWLSTGLGAGGSKKTFYVAPVP